MLSWLIVGCLVGNTIPLGACHCSEGKCCDGSSQGSCCGATASGLESSSCCCGEPTNAASCAARTETKSSIHERLEFRQSGCQCGFFCGCGRDSTLSATLATTPNRLSEFHFSSSKQSMHGSVVGAHASCRAQARLGPSPATQFASPQSPVPIGGRPGHE